ncbi:MAG: DUF1275 domain-containing protein [Bacteroidetes bacterium]|nr:DUF1275 domain-containing protein [Bacteroidota bacterium]
MLSKERTFKSNILLASFTASTAGMTNIAGVMACYAFTSNVTGHAVNFAKHMLARNFFEMFVVFGWLMMFILGAGIAHFLIRSYEYKGPYFAHALPIVVVLFLLIFIGIFGYKMHEDSENDILILSFTLLLTMGMQNSAVNTISEGKIKTSHLTGLFTDLGAELSEWLHPKTDRPPQLAQKIQLRVSILAFYILGALIGGWLFIKISYATFYAIAATLLVLIFYDIAVMRIKKETEAD